MSLMLQFANQRPSLFDDALFSDLFWPKEAKAASRFSGLGAVDIEEDSERVLIRMDIPGVKKEEVGLSFERGILTVSGERKAAGAKDEARCCVNERRNGRFTRSFQLGEKMDGDSVAAKLENGRAGNQPEKASRRFAQDDQHRLSAPAMTARVAGKPPTRRVSPRFVCSL